MKYLSPILVLLLSFNELTAKKIVCYYSSWAMENNPSYAVKPTDIDPNLCTHINYAFVSITNDGNLKVEDERVDITLRGYEETTGLKAQNPSLKVLLSIGGGSAPADMFAQIAADSVKRANMVASARWFMETYKFDGIDMDWEVPGAGDRNNFTFRFCQVSNWACKQDLDQISLICLKDNDQWLGTDNVETITAKASFIRESNVGGAMVWSIDQDDAHGHCGQTWPLLRAVQTVIS